MARRMPTTDRKTAARSRRRAESTNFTKMLPWLRKDLILDIIPQDPRHDFMPIQREVAVVHGHVPESHALKVSLHIQVRLQFKGEIRIAGLAHKFIGYHAQVIHPDDLTAPQDPHDRLAYENAGY